MPGDDQKLLLRTHRGDDAAARELWSRFAPRMLAYARTIVGGQGRRDHACDGAEDIVQSVFLSILRMPARQLRSIDDVPAWMLRLTRNAALNHLRTLRRERQRCSDRAQTSGHAASEAWDPQPDEMRDRVSRALDSLPRRHRELLILKHIGGGGGLTFDQLALALNINRSTAASRYRAALTLLRQSLETPPQSVCGREDRHA